LKKTSSIRKGEASVINTNQQALLSDSRRLYQNKDHIPAVVSYLE
jgi:hypothetical protein